MSINPPPMNFPHPLAPWYQNNLIPLNPFAMAPLAQIYESSHKAGDAEVTRPILLIPPPYNNQYGYGIPLVSIYKNEKGDVFDVSTRPGKPVKLTQIQGE